MEYIAYLHKDRKSDYGVSFPDFPGAITAGKTLEEARHLAADLLELHIRGLVEDGEEIPEASSLDDLANDPGIKDAVAFLVAITVTDAIVRINITARESQIEKIDALAEAAGLTRSAYMIQAAVATRSLTMKSTQLARKRSRRAKSLPRRSAVRGSANR
jgi:predicted RNase H-like HicB family nuclease